MLLNTGPPLLPVWFKYCRLLPAMTTLTYHDLHYLYCCYHVHVYVHFASYIFSIVFCYLLSRYCICTVGLRVWVVWTVCALTVVNLHVDF